MTAILDWIVAAAAIALVLILGPWLIATLIRNPNLWLIIVPLAFIIYHGVAAPDRGQQ